MKKRAAKQHTKKQKILNGIGRIALVLFILYTLANTVYMLTSYHADETAKAERYLPKDTEKHVLAGGNHGQFGNYGKQHGDRNATITASEQQKQTVKLIMDWVKNRHSST